MVAALHSRRRQAGVTLIELMIGVTIGLLILSALLVVYLGSRNAYRSNDSLARVQETGRFALEFIAQDARMSGFAGCRARNLSVADGSLFNVTQPALAFTSSGDGLRGFENGVGWTNPTLSTATPIARVAGDVISVRRAGGIVVGTTTNLDTVARTVTVQHNGIGLANGDLAVLGNCEAALVFRVTNNPVLTGIGNFPTVLELKATGAGASGTEGNDTSIPIPPDIFKVGARTEALRFVETSYFIGQNPAGRPGLFRVTAGTVEELVEDVEDMDIVFGVDTTLPDQDGIVDVYRRADAITPADWNRVVSMRISLLVAGPENNVTTNVQTYAFRDTDGDGLPNTQTATDRRLRQVFTTTISLRNRVL